MTDLDARIRRLMDAPPVDCDTIIRAVGPATPNRRRVRSIAVAAAVVAALVVAIVHVVSGPSATTSVAVQGGETSQPSGPPVTRTARFVGYSVTATLPHSTYPAGSTASATLTVVQPMAAATQVFRRVCLNEVFQLVFVPLYSKAQAAWNQASCPGQVAVQGGIDVFHISAPLPVTAGTYQAVLQTQHFERAMPPALPIDVTAATGSVSSPPVTMSVHLDATRVTAGQSIHGTVAFRNHTGRTITVQQCPKDGWVEVGLANNTVSLQVAANQLFDCPWNVHLPPGTTTVNVIVPTTYLTCGVGLPGGPCVDQKFPHLPAGRYVTAIDITGLPPTTQLPTPLTVTILSHYPG